MGKLNIVEKIIKNHLAKDYQQEESELPIKIDQTLTQDATGTMVYLQFETLKLDSPLTELSVSYVDHNTIQDGFENADDHRYLQTVAASSGIVFSRAGNGICHQVHLERFAIPGKTLLGSDSHTPTCGGMGMLAIGAGGIDVALAMAGMPFFIPAPKVIEVHLKNKLSKWATAKDIILEVLRILTTKGNTGCIIEYTGEGVKTLSVPERATITNMGAELGVTTSIFPSDEITKKFLLAQGRQNDWQELKADDGASYHRRIEIDLATLEPLIAMPHSPDNVKKVKEVSGTKIQQVTIGSCTNASYMDMMMVAKLLEHHTVHQDVSLVIAPGSRQVYQMLAKNGALKTFLDAGARLLESVCGFCIGNCHAPPTDGVSLRTINRNFKGRSGTPSAQVCLISPLVAAISAVKGEITDPIASGFELPSVEEPTSFLVDDSMLIKPLPVAERKQVRIVRGPNIGEPLFPDELPEKSRAVVGIKLGDKITTDDIMPAGSRLKYRSNIPKYAEFVFERQDASFAKRALAIKGNGEDVAIVGGLSYGQGSSREHAAICPKYLGVRFVIAKSFERIHFANLINYGILPLIFSNESDYEKIEQGDELEFAALCENVRSSKTMQIHNKTKNIKIALNISLTERQRTILLKGGILRYAREGVKR
jgi:aconitate hydratase